MPKDDTRILDAEDHLPDPTPSREAREVAERVFGPRTDPSDRVEYAATLIDRYAQRKVREALESCDLCREWRLANPPKDNRND